MTWTLLYPPPVQLTPRGVHRMWNYNLKSWTPLSQINVVVKLKHKEEIQFDSKLPTKAMISGWLADRGNFFVTDMLSVLPCCHVEKWRDVSVHVVSVVHVVLPVLCWQMLGRTLQLRFDLNIRDKWSRTFHTGHFNLGNIYILSIYPRLPNLTKYYHHPSLERRSNFVFT